MVIVSVYGYIDKQTDGIDRHRDRHKDRHKDGEKQYILLAYLSGLVGLSVRFTLVRIGCQIDWFRFLTSIKKIFIFPNFFSNYLIFNAFQI